MFCGDEKCHAVQKQEPGFYCQKLLEMQQFVRVGVTSQMALFWWLVAWKKKKKKDLSLK